MRKAKEQQKMVSELARGDEVMLQTGIVGRISKVGENYLTVDIGAGKEGSMEVYVQKNAVGALLPKGTIKAI